MNESISKKLYITSLTFESIFIASHQASASVLASALKEEVSFDDGAIPGDTSQLSSGGNKIIPGHDLILGFRSQEDQDEWASVLGTASAASENLRRARDRAADAEDDPTALVTATGAPIPRESGPMSK